MRKYLALFLLSLISLGSFAESKSSTPKAEGSSVSFAPIAFTNTEDQAYEPAMQTNTANKEMCYASFVFETDCPDGVVYHFDIFVYGTCYTGFYWDAMWAAYDLVLQIESEISC